MPDISINRKTYIKIGNASPISTGIAEGSLLIDRLLFAQDFAFGEFASSRMEVQIYDISNVAGQKVRVYQVENEGEQSEVTTDLYNGQVESSKLDNAGYYRDIIAYDMFYFLAKKNVAGWFNSLWTNNTTQISVLEAFQSLLTYFSIQYDSNTVNAQNFSGTLYKESVVLFEKISFKDMVKYLLEPLALIPYIGADGKCSVYSPSMANAVTLSSYDKNQSVFEEYTVSPMQWVGIANIDSSILGQQEISGNNSDVRYDIAYNPLRLDLFVDTEDGATARTTVLTSFVSKANFVEYTPCEVFMIVSDMSIKLGDRITTTRGTSYVSEMVLSGPMLVEQQLISRGSQVQQEVEEEYDPVFAYLDNRITETAEDLQEQLDDFQPSEEYLETVQTFSDTIAAGMGLKTITRTDTQTGAKTVYYYAPDSNGSIMNSTFIFTMKSTGFAWTDKWEGTVDASSESHTDPSTQQEVSTTWKYGIGADGSSLVKILNAYKISADMINTGELVIRNSNNEIIHKLSYNDKSVQLGGANGITYSQTGQNANTVVLGSNVLISGDVTIGGLADIVGDAVEDAVGDLSLNGIDRQEIKYADSTDMSNPPPSEWVSKQTYYMAYTSNTSNTYPQPLPYNQNVWKTSVSSVSGYNYTTHWLWAFTRYTLSGNTTFDSDAMIVAEKGTQFSGDESTFIVPIWTDFIPGHEKQTGKTALWVKTTTYFTDGTSESAYSVSNRRFVKNTYYGVSISSTTEPSQWFTEAGMSQLTINQGDWFWVQIVYTDNTTIYSKSYIGTDGQDGTSVTVTNPERIGNAVTFYITDGSGTPQPVTLYDGQDGDDGDPGEPGSDGRTSYVHFAWADNVTFNSQGAATAVSGFATNNANGSKKYIGSCANFESSDPGSSRWNEYSWTLVKGADGQDGQNGSDGKGISSVTTYYYATTATNSTLPSTSSVNTSGGWQSLPSNLSVPFSATTPFLWSFTKTTYTDNSTPTTTTPTIVGHYGKDGQDSSGSGAQGRGIQSITPYYALTTSDSTQPSTSDSSLWSTTPQAYSYYPSANGTKSTSSYTDIITGLSLSSGTTYTVKWKYSSSVNATTYIAITNSSGASLKTETIASGRSFGSFEYTPTSSYSNAKVRINPSSKSVSYEVTIMGTGLETKKYYWQSDKITWDDNSADTWTTPVLISALNKAIWDANEANAAIGLWCYQNDKTRIDGGKIYTGTVTTNTLAANSVTTAKLDASDAMLEKLLAYDADVVGTLTVTNNTNVSPTKKGRIEILDELSPDESTAADYRDNIAIAMYGVSYNNITGFLANIKKIIVSLRALIQYTKDNAKLIIKKETSSTDNLMALYPNGIVILSWDGSDAKASLFGHNSTIGGNLTVQGNLTVGGSISGGGSSGNASEVGSVSSQIDTVASTQVSKRIRITFDNEYSSRPKVFVTVWDESVEGYEYHFLSFGKTGDNYTSFVLEVYMKDSWYYENNYTDDDYRLPEFTVDYVVYS